MNSREEKAIFRRLLRSYVSSIVSITLVLLLVAVASLLLVNAGRISDFFKDNIKVSVLLQQNVSESDAIAYEKSISDFRFVKSTEYISKEEGTRQMEKILGEDFMDVFEVSPIPASIDISLYPAYIQPDSLEVVKSELLENPLVGEVSYPKGIIESMSANIRKISLVIGVFLLLLLFISVVLISNTVRLGVYSQRFSIHTMKLVGATNRFIRKPFIGQAIIQGLVASLLAIAMVVAIMFFLSDQVEMIFEVFPLEMFIEVIGIVIVTGVLLCVITSRRIVGKLIRLKKEELYY